MRPNAASRILRIASLTGLILLSACGNSSTDPGSDPVEVLLAPPARTDPVPAFALPAQAYDDRSLYASNPGFTPEQYDEIAAMPMAMFQLRWCLSEEAGPVIAELRRLNPDLVIIGVLQVLSVPLDWNESGLRDRFPMNGELYDLLIDRAAVTSEGEEVWMWSDARLLNPMRRGGVDHDLLTRMLNVISRYATLHAGNVDGIMHDYTSPRPWAWPDGDATHEGFIDFDTDGVRYDDDPDEISAWNGWQYALCDQLQERFGEGFIQIANGRLVLDDPELARRVAGAVIQKFPLTVWGWTAQEGLDAALRLREPGWLTPRRGQYWTFYWAATWEIDGQVDFRRHASALTGDFYETNTTTLDQFAGTDPEHFDPGAALGPLTITRNGDYTVYAREFELGTVSIEFSAAGHTTGMGISAPR